MSNRIARNIFSAMLVGSIVFAAGAASAAQLTLNWVDQAGGTAYFTIERKTETTGAYAPIATTGTGTTTYADPTVVASTTYCYRVKASNVFGDSDYSNEACGSVAAGLDFTVAKAGTGSGTVVSNPSGINCGGDCVASFAAGRVITLTATPSSGSTFSGWSGAGCSGPEPCTLVGNVPVTVTATFAAAGSAAVNSVAPNQGTSGSGDGGGTLTGSSTETTPPTLTLAYDGMLRDRVGQGNTALAPDGALDGTLTVTLTASGGRTITYLRLDSRNSTGELIGVWDTNSGQPVYWVLGTAPTLDGAMLNDPGSMAVNFPVANGGSFVLFAADLNGIEFLSGNMLTVTATFSDGSTATATTTVANASPATLTLVHNGKLRDRVGQGDTALAPDGALDGTLTATLSAPGGRTVTALRLDSNAPGTWDTTSGNMWWVLGVATTLDGPILNALETMAVNFAVADGGSFVLFASDYLGTEFLVGNTLTLTVIFADGSTATATTTVANASPATLTLVHNGKLRDRVGQDNTALAPDAALDGTLTATLSAAGGRTVTGLRLDSNAPGTWDTDSATPYWVLAVATTLDGPVLNAPETMAVNFAVADGGSFVLFASDYLGTEFLSGNTLTLTVTFADGSTATVVTIVP